MRNKKLIVLVVLGVLAGFSLFHGIVTSARPKRPPAAKEPDIQAQKKAPWAEKIILAQRTAQRTEYLLWGRNPFTLQKISSQALKGLSLNGIMWDKEKPLALINNDVVKIGDNVNGNIIVEIKQDSVILNDGTEDFALGLQ